MSDSWQGRRSGVPAWIAALLAVLVIVEAAALLKRERAPALKDTSARNAHVTDGARTSPPTVASAQPVADELAADPSAEERVDPGDTERQFRDTLSRNPKAISRIVSRRSPVGGSWGAYDVSAVKFVAPNFAIVPYDDGHESGLLVIAIRDPQRPETWQRLYDDVDAGSGGDSGG